MSDRRTGISPPSRSGLRFHTRQSRPRGPYPQFHSISHLTNSIYPVLEQVNGGFKRVEHPALNALNARLRDDFVDDCNLGVKRWNKVIEKVGIDFQLRLPHVAFHRHAGLYMDMPVSPEGKILSQKEWNRQRHQWLPGGDERQHIESLMVPQWERNQYAGWIAPPGGRFRVGQAGGVIRSTFHVGALIGEGVAKGANVERSPER